MSRIRSFAIAIGVLVAAWCAVAAPAAFAKTNARARAHAQAVPAADIGSITWGACTDPTLVQLGAQCGMLSVPLNYSDPSGPHIQLAVSKLEHTSSQADYQGAILTNPGGPGGSGLNLSAILDDVLQQEGYTSAAADYDWIGFDPRGVGSSSPSLTCDNHYFDGPRPNYIPTSRSLLDIWEYRSDQYGHDCANTSAAQSALLDNDTTIDSADDMDAIREALGQQQITYYGFSYGTYLGQVYGTLFPSHVRRMILDSNVDPRGVWYQDNIDQDTAFNRNIKIWFQWLAKYNSVYGLGSTEAAVQKLFYATQKQLAANPAGGVVGADEWTDAFLQAGYYEQTWLDLGQVFSDWIHNPDASSTADLVNAYNSAEGTGDDNEFAGYLAVQCTDTQWPTSWSQIVSDNWREFFRAPFETWDNAWFNGPCTNWPGQASTPATIDGSGVSSALLIDETLDAATPFTGSQEVRQLFPNSSLIAEPGGTSHADSLFGDTCVDGSIAAYLSSGTLPARHPNQPWDKTCAPLPKPDPTAPNASANAAKAHAAGQAQVNAGALHASQQFTRRLSRLGLAAVLAQN